MSKIKEALLKEQNNLMEYYIGFYEWLDSLNNGLNSGDIDLIEEEQQSKSYSPSSSKTIISKSEPINNISYLPIQGA